MLKKARKSILKSAHKRRARKSTSKRKPSRRSSSHYDKAYPHSAHLFSGHGDDYDGAYTGGKYYESSNLFGGNDDDAYAGGNFDSVEDQIDYFGGSGCCGMRPSKLTRTGKGLVNAAFPILKNTVMPAFKKAMPAFKKAMNNEYLQNELKKTVTSTNDYFGRMLSKKAPETFPPLDCCPCNR